jgi:hypothetical protein
MTAAGRLPSSDPAASALPRRPDLTSHAGAATAATARPTGCDGSSSDAQPASRCRATRTKAERQLVVAQQVAFNHILAQVCAVYARCRGDGGAVYHYPFSASQVSTLDFFPQPQRPGRPDPGDLGRVLVAWCGRRRPPILLRSLRQQAGIQQVADRA